LKAGEELDDRLWALDDCLGGRRTAGVGLIVGVVDMLGSKEDGIDMKDGLPIEAFAFAVGPKVGVDDADFAVAGEVSVLFP
jgi:hypothetical protein